MKQKQIVDLHLEKIHQHKVTLLEKLDFLHNDALEKDIPLRSKAIKKIIEELSQLDPDLDSFESVEEFIEYWPAIFDYRIEDYIYEKSSKLLFIYGTIIILLLVVLPIITISL